MSYAIISLGGKQYRVSEGQKLLVDRLALEDGASFTPSVLLVGGNGSTEIAPEGVTVTARRPLISQEDDKMIIDPQPIANTSTNTLEILEKTPGLFVDQDGNIYLTSATPAVVYINGREQRMGAQDIAGILRSLPPDNIHRKKK